MKLTPRQIRKLRSAPCPTTGNKVGLAIEILREDGIDVTQEAVAKAAGFSQPYVSAVVVGRFDTVTIDNGYGFGDVFGVPLEDLFPSKKQRHGAVA